MHIMNLTYVYIISYDSSIYYNILFYSFLIIISSYLSLLFLPLLSFFLLFPLITNTITTSSALSGSSNNSLNSLSLLLFILLELLLFLGYFWYYFHNYSSNITYTSIGLPIGYGSNLYILSGLLLSLLSINLSITIASLFIILTSLEYMNSLDLINLSLSSYTSSPLSLIVLTIIFLHLLHLLIGIILISISYTYPYYYHFIELIWLAIGYIAYLNLLLLSLPHLRYYLVSINLNYFYNFGFLLGITIFLQTLSGLFLTLIYYTSLELYSNIYLISYDFYYGYMYRNIHIVLATIINLLLLIHMFKGLLYNNFTNQLYIYYSGFILYLLLIIISYLGYILTYGQLSYWGATVIINLLPTSLRYLILGSYSISPITINRYLFFHIILTLVLYIFIVLHIFYLHQLSSQSTLPITISSSPSPLISFYHYIFKDITSLLILLTITLAISLFIIINLSHSNNLIPINPLVTPSHIIPEWYFLYLYSILKVIPSKLGGILTVIIVILFILLLTTSSYSTSLSSATTLPLSNINISTYNTIDLLLTIVLSYIYLSYIGLQLPIAPYLYNLRLFLLYLTLPIATLTLLSTLPINTNTTLNNIYTRNILATTSHKRLGLYYLLTAALISINGILLSIFIRLELYSPSQSIINISSISFYNYTISNHGLLMLLFIVMPIIFSSYGNYLLVLTCGLIDIPFPRINNLGYQLYLLSYILIQYSIFTEYLTGSGWTLYPPLSTITSTYIIAIMFLALSISGISSLLTSINYLLLLPYLLTINDLLLISYTITSLMILYTIPILASAFLLATSDILLSTSYFNITGTTTSGDPVLFQHLFWFFGHPEVYILIIPSFGLINYQLSNQYSTYIFGSISMILALISILIFGSLVWSHHMFTVNLESDTNLYFSILTLVIAIPTGTKLYNWLFTISSTSLTSFNTNTNNNIISLLCLIFLFMIIAGGVTGVILGNNILDIQLHDTYYVVSHFHYILSIGSILSIILTLLQLSSYINPYRLTLFIRNNINITDIILLFFSLNIIFLPMYFLGFNTMPRRIPDYNDYLYLFNSISTITVIALYISIFTLLL